MSKPNLDELEDFQRWKKLNPGITLSEYAYHNLSVSAAIAVADLIWLDLVSYQGGVFVAAGFSQTVFDSWSTKLKGDIMEIERAMNHVHLCDLALSFKTLGVQNLEYLATVISNCWRCRLKQGYPDLDFCVEVGFDAEGPDYEMTFYQRSHGLEPA